MNDVCLLLRLAPVAALGAVLAGAGQVAVAQDGRDMVGETTMVIGVARIVSGDGVVRTVDRGTAIRVGDRIETGVGGHVHLRFVDGARLSVRPSSRLQVEDYSRTGEQPELTAIRFRLDEGVVRSITGSWGEAARDRFRLNTPVAAIGVKGTDFVVKSDANNTLASVYAGAIMLTPLDSFCQASLGPCQNGSEKLLTDDMKGQMLSLGRLQAVPQLVPAVDLLAQRAGPALVQAGLDKDPSIGPENGRSDIVGGRSVAREPLVLDVLIDPAVVAAQELVPRPPEVNQLVWARLAAVAKDGDTISRSFSQAMQNGRQGTVGNVAFSLFRDVPGAGQAVLVSADSSASFRLAGSAAQLVRSERGRKVTESATVDNATLNVDFARSTYATQISVSSARIGANNLVSNGVIKTDGTFRSQGGNAYMAGALSLDGKEAGYFFEKSIAAGQLSGITQWGR